MIRAYLLYTGSDGHSHVTRGNIAPNVLINAESISFKETPPDASYDWHQAPISQYVITLSGVLEFTTKTGEVFALYRGEILIATDVTGTGHKWRLINNEPWKRAYVIFKDDADIQFEPESSTSTTLEALS